MKNKQNSSIQASKNLILPFEELYQSHLAPAVKQFKVVRRKLYFSIISVVSGAIILAIGLFMLLNFSAYDNQGNSHILWWFFIFIITALLLAGDAYKLKMDDYAKNLGFVYGGLSLGAFILFQFFNDIQNYENSLLVCVSMISVSICLTLFLASGILANYANQYREIAIDKLVKHMGVDMRYTPEGKVNAQEFINSEIRQIYPRDYNGCDLVELEYQTQAFRFSNILVNCSRGSSEKDNFMAIFLVADLSHKLGGITKIANRDVGKVEEFVEDMVRLDTLKMQTNYPKLEKYFKVSATRPQEAQALLTPEFVQRLLRFCRKINLTSSPNVPMLFRLHLKEQNLYMSFMFNAGDGRLFPIPQPMEEADYKNTLRIAYNRLKIILDFIEDLHLTTKEWATKT